MKNNKLSIYLLTFVLLITSFILIGCKNDNNEKYKVTYSFFKDTSTPAHILDEKEIEENTTVVVKGNEFNVTNEGYTFIGWKLDNIIYKPGDKFNMPAKNVTFVTAWVKNISVSFETFDGTSITPIALLEGDTLSVIDIPTPIKNDYVFVNWYLNNELTEVYNAGEYIFKDNTILYAKYTEVVEAEYRQYDEEETTLIGQSDTVSFTLINTNKNTTITDENINDYVTLSMGDITMTTPLPSLKVSELADGRYLLVPSKNYDSGQEYIIEAKNGCFFEVNLADNTEDKQLKNFLRVNFSITNETTNNVTYKDDIIWLSQGEYSEYIKGDILILKDSIFINKGINNDSIISITSDDSDDEDTEPDQEFYRAGNFTKLNLDGISASYVEIKLLECELTDVYESLEYYEETVLELEKYVDNIDQDEIIKEVKKNRDLNYFMRLAAVSAADYTNKANISVVNQIEEKDPEVDFSIDKHNKLSFTATIKADGVYKLSKDVYAKITVIASQYIYIGLQGKGEVKLTEWNFDVMALLTSTTEVKFDVVLIKDGKEINIKDKIQKGLDEYEPNSFVAQYKEVLGMKTKELNIIRVTLLRPYVVLGHIFELGFPIDFVVSVDVNGAFSADVTCTVKKNFGIRGNSSGENEGVKSYTKNVSTKYEYDFYYYGKTTLKAGISFGLELSFNNLSSLGRAGLEIEVGAYFEFSGYGSYYVNYPVKIENYNSDTIKKARGGYYYEFGIYLELNLYFRSDIFDFSADYTAIDERFKLFDGGNELMAVKFSDSNDKNIQTSSNSLDISKLNIYNIDFMKLANGSITTRRVTDNILIFVKGTGLYIDENNKICVYDQYKNIRIDGQILIRYYGLHANLAGSYLDYTINYSYIPNSLNIDPKDLNKTFNVRFMVENEVYETQQVKIGYSATVPFVSDEWMTEHPQYMNIVFDHRVLEPIMADTDYHAWVRIREGAVMFRYLLIDETLAAGKEIWDHELIDASWGETCDDLLKRLDYKVGDVDEQFYIFKGWPTFEPITFEDDNGTLRVVTYSAIYEKKDVKIDVHIEPFINSEGKTLIAEKNYSYYVPFMNTSNEFLISTLYPGFEQEFRYDNAQGELIHTTGNSFIAPRFYDNCTIWSKYTQTKQFTVRILRADGSVIYERNDITYGEDVRDMMNNQAVLDYIAEGPVPANIDPSLPFEYEFNGAWYLSVDNLRFIFEDVDLKPCFDYIHTFYKVYLDGNGGNIPGYMSYMAENGWELSKNIILKNDLFTGSEPTRSADENSNYVFSGWAYKDSNNNLVPIEQSDYQLTKDITLYALWDKSERTFKVSLIADKGIYYSTSTGTSIEISSNIPLYENEINITKKDWQNLSINAKENLITKLTSQNGPIPIPVNETDATTYVFSHWQISEFIGDDLTVLEPVYKLANGSVDIICHLEGGELEGIKDTYIESLLINANESVDIGIGNYIDPTSYNEYKYNSLGELEEQSYQFKDENYYYIFTGWIFNDETEVMNEDRRILLQANSPDINLTATYQKVPQTKTIKFEIQTLYPYNEAFTDGDDSWVKTFYGNYGSELNSNLIPTVSKTDSEEFSLYEYVFEGWQCEQNGKMEVNKSFDNDYLYKPVFTKKLRDLTIIFDAGEMGIFPSTGERYRKIETFAGVTLYDFGEEPIYDFNNQEIELYYDYEFMYWDYVIPYIFNTTESEVTVTALFKPIRNKTAAPDTGIIVTKDGKSEDIGKNTISGYEYNPNDNELIINEPGFIIDGQNGSYDLKLWIATNEVTLKDITLTTVDDTAIYTTYYPQEESQSNLVVMNIMGSVSIKGEISYDGFIGVFFVGDNMTIKGVNADSELNIEVKFTNTEATFLRAINAHIIKFNDIDVNIDLETNAPSTSIYGFDIRGGREQGEVTLNNSIINVKVIGGSLGKAFVVNLGSNGIITPGSEEYFNLINCELFNKED